LGLKGDCIPPQKVVALLNDRTEVMSILEEAVRDLENIRTPHYLVLTKDDLPFRGVRNLSKEKPSSAWKLLSWWEKTLADKGFEEQPFYALKPTDHSKKGTRLVTFCDISGFQTLLNLLYENDRVLVEQVDLCRWSEKYFSAGSVNEIKTLTVNTQ